MIATLNFNHLRYFWTVARLGSVTRAGKALHLTQPTVSAQLRLFEKALGHPLFERAGRRLELTEHGRVLFRYAEEIFSLEREVYDTLAGLPTGRPPVFRIGVADSVPKLLTSRLVAPLLDLEKPARVVCREGGPDALLAALGALELDLVLLDAPPAGGRHHVHELGESALAICGAPSLVTPARRGFPGSLDGRPFLLPGPGALRHAVEGWWRRAGIAPHVLGEFDDSALLKVMASEGRGFVAVPEAIVAEVARRFGLRAAGVVPEARVRYYAITLERRLAHPAARALAGLARQALVG
jgi:LysR family transcriptional activator of nhaA